MCIRDRFYAAALGACFVGAGRRSVILTAPYMMCMLCWVTVVGFWRFATHRQPVTWERVPPSTVPAAAESGSRAAAQRAA